MITSKAKTTAQFIAAAVAKHGETYDYTRTTYAGVRSKVMITCRIHGDFTQTPNAHLNGQGCPQCGVARRSASVRRSQEDFVAAATQKHAGVYDYSCTEYKNSSTPVTIVCRKHGAFTQVPSAHLNGQGCPQCGIERRTEAARSTTDEFVARARAVHGDVYEYTKSVYTGTDVKLTITCRVHGDFEQVSHSHLSGRGCPQCRSSKIAATKRAQQLGAAEESHYHNMSTKLTLSDFLARAAAKHGDRYTYDTATFKDSTTKMNVVCRTHGVFSVAPAHHMQGRGCPQCRGSNISAAKSNGLEWFLSECRKTHGDKYDYSAISDYTAADRPYTIVCRKHGAFEQNGWAHKSGQGCPACGTERAAAACRYTKEEYVAAAVAKHGDKYTYPGDFNSAKGKIEVVCPTHGAFWQEATSHLQGRGCPSCAKATLSSVEWDIIEYIKSFGVDAKHAYRPAWLGGKELDVFVPSHNLAIEYCGAWVHNSTRNPFGEPKSPKYHYDKWKLCRDNGVTLLTVYDFEWMAARGKWEAVIRHKLQKADRRVYARKCKIVPVERAVAYQFCKEHHIEGAGGAWTFGAECRGLEYAGELVAVMVLDNGDIKRSCTLSGTAVIGGVSKLFKSFPPGTTMMTTNNTGSSGNYGTLVDKYTLRYWWVKLGTTPVAYPRRQCQKHLLERRFGVPVGDMTERQYMESLGFVKCYDSGLSFWVNR